MGGQLTSRYVYVDARVELEKYWQTPCELRPETSPGSEQLLRVRVVEVLKEIVQRCAM